MVKVKICGITNEEDALLACKYGADALGMVVDVPVNTPRKITRKRAQEIISVIPPSVTKVIVTMPNTIKELKEIDMILCPDMIQIHSDIDVKILNFYHQCKIIKTIHVFPDALNLAKKFEPYVDAILLDTMTNIPGGSGVLNDLKVCSSIVKELKKPTILAGGLNPNNVENAIRIVKPYAVDASSGVESHPGKKDPEKLKEFIEKVKKCRKS